MQADHEVLQTINTQNILAPLISERAVFASNLSQSNLRGDQIKAFGKMIGLECQTIADYEQGTYRLLFNPVSGLVKEDAARSLLLNTISERAVLGTDELAIIETDMNDLKGINDIFGDAEGDRAIRAFADSLQSRLVETIQQGGYSKVKFALVNKHGEGSDSIKILLVGPNISEVVDRYTGKIEEGTKIALADKITKQKSGKEIKGGYGFCVMTNDQIKKYFKPGQAPYENAGDTYTHISNVAYWKMVTDKVRSEAEIANHILSVKSLEELMQLESEIEALGERIPRITIQYLFNVLKEIALKQQYG